MTATSRERLEALFRRMLAPVIASRDDMSATIFADEIIRAGWVLPTPEAPQVAVQRRYSCGCVTCVCDDEERCHGCGAKDCGDRSTCVRKRVVVEEATPEAEDAPGFVKPDKTERLHVVAPEAEDRETARVCAVASAIMDAGVDCADTFARDVIAGLRYRGYDVQHSAVRAQMQAQIDDAQSEIAKLMLDLQSAEAALERARAVIEAARAVDADMTFPEVLPEGACCGRRFAERLRAALESPC